MKRDPAETYWKLIDKFAQCPTGEVRHFEYPHYAEHHSNAYVNISYAHKACLCYLIWLNEQHLESCEAFLDAAVTWRKQTNRYATHRTSIEKLARVIRRKVLPKLRTKRAQSWGGVNSIQKHKIEGIGIFSPDYPPERRKETGRMGAIIAKNIPKKLWCKKWWICDPKGNWFVIENMSAFCREHGLDDKYMKHQASYGREFFRGGWNCRKYRETDLKEDGLPPFASGCFGL